MRSGTRRKSGRQEKESGGSCGSCPPSPCIVCQMTPGDRDVKDYETDDIDEYDDAQDDQGGEDDVAIDDGLLDDVFEEEAAGGSNSDVSPRNSNSGNGNSNNGCNSCQAAVCVMGGSNDGGAVAEVASVMAGSKYSRTPRGLYINPFPAFMTQGDGRTFSFYTNNNLFSCTPGYTVSSFSPYSRQIVLQYVPGSCNNYDFSNGQWTTRGGQMSSFRQAGSLVNVGSYIMAVGGQGQSGQLNQDVELFDPR